MMPPSGDIIKPCNGSGNADRPSPSESVRQKFAMLRQGTEYLSYANLGLEMGAAIAVGLGIGWFLDRSFKTRPWLTIIFLLLGVGAGFKNIIRLIIKEMKNTDGQ